MKAIIRDKYGSPAVLALREVEKPTPGDNDLLVRVSATALNAADWRMLRADPFLVRFMAGGVFTPKLRILGADVAGRVEAVGKQVTQFKPGDAVFGDLAGNGFGGLAEYVCAPETLWAHKPSNLSFVETAALPMAAVTALQSLRDVGELQPGQQVMIHGASGGVGTFAVQMAKALGGEVTAVCSTTKMATARELGADHVIDYTQEDFARSGRTYDLILAANGSRSLSDYLGALKPGGTFATAGGAMSQLFKTMLLGPILTRSNGKSTKVVSAHPTQADLDTVREMVEDGRVTPVIDRCYPLAETAEAFRYLEAGHARGKVVVVIDEQDG